MEHVEKTGIDLAEGCPRCGSLIAERGQQRHEAWHDFLESGITALTADLAVLKPPAD